MERLTYRDSDGRSHLTIHGAKMYCSVQATADCIAELEESLTAYKDTGLEPEEIEKANNVMVSAFNLAVNSGTEMLVGRLKEIIRAEAEGRLLILPCKVGDTVFWVPDLKKSDWIIEDTVIGFIVEENRRIRLMLPGLCMEPIYPQTHLFLTREEAEAALRGADAT